MNITELLKSDDFLNTDQFYKRRKLKKYILEYKDCKIGLNVLCFDDEVIILEKNRFFYNKSKNKKKIKTLSIGKEYVIIECKEGTIQIKNDNGHKLWYTPNRFLLSLKMERKQKLEKIKNNII